MVPRLKSFEYFSRDGDFVIRPDIGVELRIHDPDGQVAYLCSLLAAHRSVAGLHAEMQARWPDITLDDVVEGIEGLGSAGVVEDAEAVAYDLGSSPNRYGGNLAFFEAFDTLHLNRHAMQRAIEKSHVLLLGLGGVGSSLLMNLAGLGVGHITLVDLDSIELPNLNRQFLYTERDISSGKVETAAAWVRSFNSGIRIEAVERRISSTADVASLLDGVDLVLMAIDEPPIEVDRWVNEACVREGVPFVAGGLRLRRALYFSVFPSQTGCLECLDLFQGEQTHAPEIRLGDSGSAPSIAPAVTLIASLMSMEVTRHLSGFAPPVSAGKIWLVDLESGQMGIAFEWPRDPACSVCGDADTHRASGTLAVARIQQ